MCGPEPGYCSHPRMTTRTSISTKTSTKTSTSTSFFQETETIKSTSFGITTKAITRTFLETSSTTSTATSTSTSVCESSEGLVRRQRPFPDYCARVCHIASKQKGIKYEAVVMNIRSVPGETDQLIRSICQGEQDHSMSSMLC